MADPKPYAKVKAIPVPLYRGRFIIILSNSVEEVQKTIPEFKKEQFYGHSWHINYKNRDGFAMVLNFENKISKMTHGTIAHESVHIANFIADSRGLVSDFDNDEPITYLVQWIVDQTYLFIEKNKLKVNVKM